MIKLIIRNKNNDITHTPEFPNEGEMQAWLDVQNQFCTLGKPERWVTEAQEDISSAVDSREVELEGQAHTEYKMLAEYSIETVDVTAELAQQAANQQARQYLADTDWYIISEMDTGEACPADVKAARSAARSRIQN